MKRDLAVITLHYLVGVLWTNELDDFNAFDDIDPDSKAVAMTVVQKFLNEASPLLTKEWTDEQIGHDLWLTRGGHGAGFWDRDLPNGKEISDICNSMEFHGEVFEADGIVYINDTL
jgi:hypothetical protein